ncbi:hypothetical protein QBZ16_002348 [Prototheca wickerhamii]|uniref:sn-1-specific diacylglycerol lipase n=1 Tax=Prototheca wickerhamii TaxID=3111 RepID=A0AAD9MMP7_PROWI|nr:hypothetical protein QBZ16_002348 [Prototheca wickerhamii]
MGSAARRVRRKARKGAILTAGMVTSLLARVSHAFVDGAAFALSSKGGTVVVGAELAVLGYRAGPARTFDVAWKALILCVVGRAVYVVYKSLQVKALSEQQSVWDWAPEEAGMETGAWSVLRQLAIEFGKMRDQSEDIADLLSDRRLQPQELASRLYYMYCHNTRVPVSSEIGDSEPVPEDIKRKLLDYRKFAIMPYDYLVEDGLAVALAKHDYTLLCSSCVPDMDSGSPAFFCALNDKTKEVLISVRGTASAEDVFMDVLATGAAFDDDDIMCHSGMCKAVRYLSSRFRSFLLAMDQAGYRITLVGHSLGAGVASLWAAFLKRKGTGADSLACYAYEVPPCMDLRLAHFCKDIVVSVVHGDDIVPRMCTESLASFLQDLADFDWQKAMEEEGLPKGLQLLQHLGMLLPWGAEDEDSSGESEEEGRASSGSKGEATRALSTAADDLQHVAAQMGDGGAGSDEVTEGQGMALEQSASGMYKPFVPGRVVFIGRDSDGRPLQRLLPDVTAPILRTIRLTPACILDHSIDSVSIAEALGEDPAKSEFAKMKGLDDEADGPLANQVEAATAKDGSGERSDLQTGDSVGSREEDGPPARRAKEGKS